jgi:O-antigen/teichoic acid export membrane protein
MLNNLLRTFGIRITTAILSLLIVVVCGQMLGAAALGEISLFIVAITIINLVGGFAGGAALVYLIPRNSNAGLLSVSNVWAFLSAFVVAIVLYVFNAFPVYLFWHVLVLGLIGSLNQNLFSVLLANQNIKLHNFLSLLQSVLMILFLLGLTIFAGINSIYAYVFSMYASYIPVFSVLLFVVKNANVNEKQSFINNFKILFAYGSLIQLSSILALLTYRLTYYYTEAWLGFAALGILAVAAQISEAVWILPKSIAMVQFSKISNLKDDSNSAHLTFFLAAVTTVFSLFALTVLFFIPDWVYAFVFGKDFTNVRPIVQIFTPGILAMSVNIILSHYFSGTGRVIFNMIGSAIGLVSVAVSGYIFIRNGNLNNAAMVSSIGYIANFIFALLCFLMITKKEKISFGKGYAIMRGQS